MAQDKTAEERVESWLHATGKALDEMSSGEIAKAIMVEVYDTGWEGADKQDLLSQRLARTPYLVIPKLACAHMPVDWQERMEALLAEADAAGLCTPSYNVFRSIEAGETVNFLGCRDVGTWDRPFYKLVGRGDDPWANYRHGNALELSAELK